MGSFRRGSGGFGFVLSSFFPFRCSPLLTCYTVNSLQIYAKGTSTHLALSALSSLPKDVEATEENIRAAAVNIIGQDAELPEEFDKAAGEL